MIIEQFFHLSCLIYCPFLPLDQNFLLKYLKIRVRYYFLRIFSWIRVLIGGFVFQTMAGGVMGQVQGLIPGMKREEDVPDPAAPAEGEYQEYAVSFYFLRIFSWIRVLIRGFVRVFLIFF